MLIAWLSRPMSELPRTSATIAPSSGSSAARTDPPKTTSRTASAAITPTATVNPGSGRSELLMDWPLREMCTVASVGGFRRLDQVFGVGVGHLRGLLIPGHHGEGDGAVPADLRRVRLGVGAGHGFHPGHGGHLGQRRRHLRPYRRGSDRGAVGGLDDDLVALTRRGREVVRQQGDRRLRVGVGQAEARAEIGARRLSDPDHGDHGEQPGGRHPPPMLETPASQS